MKKTVPAGNARKRRLFACACCRRAWRLFAAESQLELGAAENLADDTIKRKQAESIREPATKAHPAAPPAKTRYVRLPRLSAWTVCRHACDAESVRGAFTAARKVSELLAADTAGPPPYDGMGPPDEANQLWQNRYQAALESELTYQAAVLRDFYSTPLCPVEFDPGWRTPAVTTLAAAIYEERSLPGGELDASRLATLAEALANAGCAVPVIIDHLRLPGVQYRGCWVVHELLEQP